MHQSNFRLLSELFKQEVYESDIAVITSMSELKDGCRYICFKYDGEYRIVHYNKYGMASIKAVVKWNRSDVIRSVTMQMKWREYRAAIEKKV